MVSDDILTTYSCTFSALLNIFKLNNVNIRVEELFCMLNGFNISFEHYDKGIDMPDLFTELKKYGITYKKVNMSDIDAYDQLLSALLKHHYGVTYARTYYLDYNQFYHSNENVNRTHFIISGKIEDNYIEIIDSHYTSDCSYKIHTYKGKMKIQSFLQAAKTIYFINLEDFHYEHLNVFDTFNKLLKEFLNGNVCEEKIYGLPAVRTYLLEIIKYSDIDILKEQAIEVNYNLKICSIVYILNYMEAILNEYGMDDEIINYIKKVRDIWNRLVFHILKAGIKKDIKEFNRIINDQCIDELDKMKEQFKKLAKEDSIVRNL